MTLRTALIYSSTDGQTLKICKELRDVLAKKNQSLELYSIDDFDGDISGFDRIVIGASIRYGIHNKKIIDFINVNKEQLDAIRTAFFSVNLVARKPEKSAPTTNPYVVKFFKSIDWKPNMVEVFAGMLDYQKYPFFDRIMIQLIMWMTKGPTNSDAKIEYTDWEKVREFGKRLSSL